MNRASVFATALLGLAAVLAPTLGAAQNAGTDFKTSDRNGDDVVDAQEYRLRMVEVFYFADQNKDGSVTIGELQAVETVEPSAFRAADKNGDGVLVLQEFIEFRMTDFREADTDSDGRLSSKEVQSWNAGHGVSGR